MRIRLWRVVVIWLLLVVGWGVMAIGSAGPVGETDRAGVMSLLGTVFGFGALLFPGAYLIAEWAGTFEARED